MDSAARWPAAVALILLLGGCGDRGDGPPPELRSAVSWVATAVMVTEAWTGGKVPTPYAEDTLATGQRRMSQARRRLGSSGGSDPLGQAEEAVERLRAAVQRRDRGAADAERAGLARLLTRLGAQGTARPVR